MGKIQHRRSVSMRRYLFDRLHHFVGQDPRNRNYCSVVDAALTEYLDKHGAISERDAPPAKRGPAPGDRQPSTNPHPMDDKPSFFTF